MAIIKITTIINAPIKRCFNLALSVDLHKESVATTNEKAIAGITTGIMQLHDTVTWLAIHFGISFNMTSIIPILNKPTFFVSQMTKGPFKKLYHQHLFEEKNGQTIMTDVFEFEAPFGLLGKLVEKLILIKHMNHFLIIRNAYLKKIAESDGWRRFVKEV
jgi:ligand-binding SRPBCC domain-containing protein